MTTDLWNARLVMRAKVARPGHGAIRAAGPRWRADVTSVAAALLSTHFPPCANCGNRTFLARRSPASDHALHLERQIFACLECNLDFERVVGADGKAVRSTALASS